MVFFQITFNNILVHSPKGTPGSPLLCRRNGFNTKFQPLADRDNNPAVNAPETDRDSNTDSNDESLHQSKCCMLYPAGKCEL